LRLSRAQFLRAIAAAPAAMLADTRGLFAQLVEDDVRARAAAAIAAYDAQGLHRTGTDVDNASARWLADLAAQAGGAAALEPFPLQRIDVRAALVRANGRIVEGLPFFDGGFTDAAGVSGRLGPPERLTEIALVRLDQAGISSEGRSLADLRRGTAHRAIVAITEGTAPGLSPSNAALFARPYGVPVLQVGSEHQGTLGEFAASGAAVTLIAHVERSTTSAQNVVVSVPGTQPALPPLVIITPRSGWWHCASERGGGLACWLEIIRAVAAARPERPAIFVASSGHELGHYGLDRFIEARPGIIRQAAAWMHLGANIGAAGGAARLQAKDDEIEAIVGAALQAAGAAIRQRVPRGTVPAGEARNIHTGGGRYVSVLGSGPRFHNILDRWPDAVSTDTVTRFATALGRAAMALARA
jgi:hypothetical protein